MEKTEKDEEKTKLNLETEKQMCRCCLTTEKRMNYAVDLQDYFMELACINVTVSDGVPQWVCYECTALLKKAVTFKYKILCAQTKLYEYLSRCAPFPIEPGDPELAQYATPQLAATDTLVFDSKKHKIGFHPVLQQEKRTLKSELLVVPLLPSVLERLHFEGVKEEATFSDFEDDLPLEEFRSTNKEDSELIITEPEVKRKNTPKEPKSKRKKRIGINKDETNLGKPRKGTIRKPIVIDPEKIRIITLNPTEQIRQREEESKTHVKFPYKCHLCFKGFNFESKLQNHMQKHSPSRGPYECKLCTMYLPTMYSYTVHSLIHTRRYECVQCGRRMIDRASIFHHYRTQHEGISTVFTCDLCGKISSNSKTHRGHMRNHHSGERPKCDQCGKSFVNKDSLTEHMQIHDGVMNYECSVCGKLSRTRAQMKHHQLKHSTAKDYYCVECDVRFKSSHSLRQHLSKSLKHQDVNSLPFACSRCDKRFAVASHRESHARVQHDGVRAFPCAECGAALATRASRDKHARRHAAHAHAHAPPPARHVCDTCGKAFRGKSVLTNHLRTHTGEKPYACGVCGRAFSQRTARQTHLKLVHLKIRNNKVTTAQTIKNESAPPPAPAPPRDQKQDLCLKNEPQIVYDMWSRPCDVFYVTAGDSLLNMGPKCPQT